MSEEGGHTALPLSLPKGKIKYQHAYNCMAILEDENLYIINVVRRQGSPAFNHTCKQMLLVVVHVLLHDSYIGISS
jgi:hypothetical protein